MELSLTATLTVVGLSAALFTYATWRVRQPWEPLKMRFVNYHVVQLACIVVTLLMAAHLITWLTGG